MKTFRNIPFFFLVFLFTVWPSCHTEHTDHSSVPFHVWSIPFPAHNFPTGAKITLGEKLFSDPVLSLHRDISCASCHKPALAFADTVRFSQGAHGNMLTRNTPSLWNIGFRQALNADGGVPDLESHALGPMQENTEMALNLKAAVQRLDNDPVYRQMFERAFGTRPSPGAIVRALAAFQRTLIPPENSPIILTAQAETGKNLFFSSRTSCSICHSGSRFTNNTYQDIGLSAQYDDPGRGRVTSMAADSGKFKVPGLSGISSTYPYMHNGSIRSLREVVEFYNSGGLHSPNQSPLVRPLHLSAAEIDALTAYLQTL